MAGIRGIRVYVSEYLAEPVLQQSEARMLQHASIRLVDGINVDRDFILMLLGNPRNAFPVVVLTLLGTGWLGFSDPDLCRS